MQHGCSLQSKQARIITILARLSILALLTLVSLCSVAYDTGTAHAQNQRTAKSKLPTPWWHHLTNERALDAVRYGFTLQDVQNNLDSYQAQGYQVEQLCHRRSQAWDGRHFLVQSLVYLDRVPTF